MNWAHKVSAYTSMCNYWGWIILVKGEDEINNGKTSTTEGFYAAKILKKIIQWSPLLIIFKGKIKIAHLLPEQSAHQDDHFLQTWPFLSGALD